MEAVGQGGLPDAGSPFGMGIYLGNRYTPEDMVRAARMAQAIGVKWSREEFSWGYIQPEEGQWRWDRYDRAVEVAQRHGISLFGLLDYCAPWASTAPDRSSPDAWKFMPDLGAWSEYVGGVVGRYRDRIRFWEIWNEPNISVFWGPKPEPVEYARLLRASYRVIKEADPDAQVIGIDTAGSDLAFIESVFREGGYVCMDILSTHPYRYPRTPEESDFVGELRRTVELMERWGGKKPLWLTEIGWPTHAGDQRSSTEQKQAAMIVRMYIQAIASDCVDKIFWYDYRNDGTDERYNEHNFGIIRQDFSPKPAYAAFGTMTRQIGGARFVRSVDLCEGVNAYVFEGQGGHVLALWSAEGTRKVEIGVKSATVVDLLGKQTRRRLTGGVLKLDVSGDPVFIEGKLTQLG